MPAWSGLFDGVYNESYVPQFTRIAPFENVINRLVRSMGHNAAVELLDTVLGASAGGTAAKTHTQILAKEAGVDEGYGYGGKRTIETVTDINRATTAGDVTALKNMLTNRYTLASAQQDLGGNSPKGTPEVY